MAFPQVPEHKLPSPLQHLVPRVYLLDRLAGKTRCRDLTVSGLIKRNHRQQIALTYVVFSVFTH